jgi:hypothetical protein
MKLVFNETLLSSVSQDSSNISDDIKILASNLILEKKIVTAQVADMNDLFRQLNALRTPADRAAFLKRPYVETFLNTTVAPGRTNRDIFHERTTSPSSSGSGSNQAGSMADEVRNQIQEGARTVEDPGSKFAPFLETKETIIARLNAMMNANEAREIFYQFEEKLKLPFTDVIGIIDYCINKSRACSAKASDILHFFIEHYGQKLQMSTVKNIIDLACDYQKLNPTIDIFSVLRDAIAGNQPKVNLGYLSKDPQDQLIFNQLIMLSQASLPEQSSEIRRRFQHSRDALNAQEQKFNMQRAIFDMMKTEEANNQLVKMIEGMGEGFKALVTMPFFRALRSMYYDLRSAKIILNQASSIFGADISPENRPRRPSEDIYNSNTQNFPQIPESRKPFSEPYHKFLKLASPEVTKHIYAQTAPKVDPKTKNDVLKGLKEIFDAIGGQYQRLVEAAKNIIEDKTVKQIINFFIAFSNAVRNIISQIQSNSISENSIIREFQNVEKSLTPDKTIFSSHNSYIKTAQYNSQIGNPQISTNTLTVTISNAVAAITSIGGIVLGVLAIKEIGSKLFPDVIKGQWTKAALTVLPIVAYVKNLLIESLAQFNFFGRNAPQSATFYDASGNLTNIGRQILVNEQETLIAAGVADEDANALAKFSVQSTYLMNQLATKEENLKNSEQQLVQLGGGKTDYTVGDLPEDFKVKLKDFLDFCKEVENQYKAALNIFRNAFKKLKPGYLNSVQKTQMTGLLAKFEKELIEVQRKRAEWSSMKNISQHLIRKKILLQKLKPLLTQMDTLKKLGIPVSTSIASPNGILAQAGAIRNEVYQALLKARKDYYEVTELLKNPDIITPMVKYPTDTNMTKLPESPDQSISKESPFFTDKDVDIPKFKQNDQGTDDV